MNRFFLLSSFLFACSSATASPFVHVPATLIDQIRKDYSNRAGYSTGRPIIIVQKEQSIHLRSPRRFAVVPFMYLPNEPESWRQCVVRVLSSPALKFVQDLTVPGVEEVGLPCNGVVAIGVRDLNSDNYGDLTILYDFATRGNPDLRPYLAIYIFNPVAGIFRWDEVLSEKAGRKDPATIKEAYSNLKHK